MPHIKFLPAGIILEAPSGAKLMDAARQAGITIALACGGKGTCGKCLVQVSAGAVDFKAVTPLSDEERAAGLVHACQCTITTDATITIPHQQHGLHDHRPDDRIDPAGTQAIRLEAFNPLTRRESLLVPPARMEDGLSDLDRLRRSLAQTGAISPAATFPLPVLQSLADTLRQQDGHIRITHSQERGYEKVIAIQAGAETSCNPGLAIDLGTTTISVQLIDLEDGTVLATRNGYNEQINFGLDVISRINYAARPGRLEDLSQAATGSLNRLIREACTDADLPPQAVTAVRISGNTVMTHLLLGLPPEHIRREPYTPTVLQTPPYPAAELGLCAHPQAVVSLSPCVGSYVGGDITAGLLVTGLAREQEAIGLFIDIGTNGEIVLGNRDFLMTCACSAGPAFEGGGIDCGMRATTGAIDHVQIDAGTGQPSCTVIGGGKALGVCGSGLIDLIAGLFLTGWLDAAGHLDRTRPCPAIHVNGRRALYTLVTAEQSGHGEAITLSEIDIENILRAKAAIYSATSLLLQQAGIGWDDLDVYEVAGGFGRYLDMPKAVAIGLLPDIAPEKFRYLGNASLAGSRLGLLSEKMRTLQTALAQRMTYLDLSTFPGYMDHYTAALFLPHTDSRLFPSVRPLKL